MLDCLTAKVKGATHPTAQLHWLDDLAIQQLNLKTLRVACGVYLISCIEQQRGTHLHTTLKLSTPGLDTDVSVRFGYKDNE